MNIPGEAPSRQASGAPGSRPASASERPSAIGRAMSALADLFFPRICAGCGRTPDDPDRAFLCRRCEAALKRLDGRRCRICGRSAPGARETVCGECRDCRPAFAMARAPFAYEPPVSELLQSFKYTSRIQIGDYLGDLLARQYPTLEADFAGADLLVPVPLHPLRWIERGFNQAEVLARRVSRAGGIPLLDDCLVRVRHTAHQVGLAADSRRDNMRGAFRVYGAERIAGRTVVLVDDVVTTGATMEAGAEALRRAGAARVLALALATPACPERRRGVPPANSVAPGEAPQ